MRQVGGRDARHLTAAAPDEVDRLVVVLALEVEPDDPRPLASERERGGTSETSAAAGDQDDFVLDEAGGAHVVPALCVIRGLAFSLAARTGIKPPTTPTPTATAARPASPTDQSMPAQLSTPSHEFQRVLAGSERADEVHAREHHQRELEPALGVPDPVRRWTVTMAVVMTPAARIVPTGVSSPAASEKPPTSSAVPARTAAGSPGRTPIWSNPSPAARGPMALSPRGAYPRRDELLQPVTDEQQAWYEVQDQ